MKVPVLTHHSLSTSPRPRFANSHCPHIFPHLHLPSCDYGTFMKILLDNKQRQAESSLFRAASKWILADNNRVELAEEIFRLLGISQVLGPGAASGSSALGGEGEALVHSLSPSCFPAGRPAGWVGLLGGVRDTRPISPGAMHAGSEGIPPSLFTLTDTPFRHRRPPCLALTRLRMESSESPTMNRPSPSLPPNSRPLCS